MSWLKILIFFLTASLKVYFINICCDRTGIKLRTSQFKLSMHPKPVCCKPNRDTIQPKFWKGNGYNPNNKTLPKFWSCPWFGHAKILVGLVGAQTKHTLRSFAGAISPFPNSGATAPPSPSPILPRRRRPWPLYPRGSKVDGTVLVARQGGQAHHAVPGAVLGYPSSSRGSGSRVRRSLRPARACRQSVLHRPHAAQPMS
jgi:hypothetical protein